MAYKDIKSIINQTALNHHLSKTPELIVVSKNRSIEQILSIINQGQRIFAENYLSEALPKIQQINPPLQWHFIGALQSNKLKKIAQYFDTVQSVSSLEHLQKLDHYSKMFSKKLNILLQINIDKDPNKSGIDPENIFDFIESILKLNLQNIQLKGLMTILKKAATSDLNQMDKTIQSFKSFKSLKNLQSTIQKKYHLKDFTECSMGMSQDLIPAIKSGATMVRVGRAVFNENI